jgi:peptide/nickel transport system substrate-binding protein
VELRENVRWHDGRAFTPDDVVFSFEYFATKRPMLPANLLGRPEGIASVRATGARTVEIRMEQPSVAFAANTLNVFPIVPMHVWSGVDDPTTVQDQQRFIGTGPYRLASYARGEGAYAFDAVDTFFLGRPFVKRLELRQVGDELTALRAGEIDIASPGAPAGTRPEVLAPFRSDPAYGVVETPPGGFVNALYWNLTRGGVLADVRFRQACARAIDRNQVVQRVLGGNGVPGNPGYLPPGHAFRTDVEQYGFDPAAANRLLDDAGYRMGDGGVRQGPNGPLRFRLLTVAPPLAEVVSTMLKAVGIEANIEPAPEFQQFAMQMTRGNFEMAMLFHGGLAGDPDFMRGVFSSRVPANQKAFFGARGYANPELDDLLDRQRTTFDDPERKRLVAQAQQVVARDLPVLHLFYPTGFRVFRKAAFDQWPSGRNEPPDKQVLVTGHKSRDLNIRPSR